MNNQAPLSQTALAEDWTEGNREQLLHLAYTYLRNGFIRDLRYRYQRDQGLYRIRFFRMSDDMPEGFFLNFFPDPPWTPEEEQREAMLQWTTWS